MFLTSEILTFNPSDNFIIFKFRNTKKANSRQKMKAGGRHFETIWLKPGDPAVVQVIDQRFLPFDFVIEDLKSEEEVFTAIREMHIRGAPLIGAAAAFGMYLAQLNSGKQNSSDAFLEQKAKRLKSARPTAVNLSFCVDRMVMAIAAGSGKKERSERALETALQIVDEERENSKKIGEQGVSLIEAASRRKRGEPVNILTHCNAGWLACIDYGSTCAHSAMPRNRYPVMYGGRNKALQQDPADGLGDGGERIPIPDRR
jgi:methylthioribose-1-phosphate isomerase